MVAQESIHFSLTDPDAEDEWLWTGTPGDGHIRLGKDMRMFAVAMFHQLHCLRGIRNAMVDGWKNLHPAHRGHIHHCFNYVRQYTLCDADVTLEPGDFTKRNFTLQRTGATHTCLDWEPAYEMMRDQWLAWEAYREANNIPEGPDDG
jgi:Mycotoxin biosynthesis protein UstYa